jgi:hypothetical protein
VRGARLPGADLLTDLAFELPLASTPERLAGTLLFDDAASGGPKVDVAFDAALSKSFDAAR